MRDVDLFISVTSIGADPEWLDRGEDRRFEQYWHRYSFGDLTATAQVRHEVLVGLLPTLAIACRCELTGRFLKVRGDLRTYKIHPGSGNILMSPDDDPDWRPPRNGRLDPAPERRGKSALGPWVSEAKTRKIGWGWRDPCDEMAFTQCAKCAFPLASGLTGSSMSHDTNAVLSPAHVP